MPNYLSTNPRYFCRNVQYFSEFYSNLSFSLFFSPLNCSNPPAFGKISLLCANVCSVLSCTNVCAFAPKPPVLTRSPRLNAKIIHGSPSARSSGRFVRFKHRGLQNAFSIFQRSALHLLLYDMTAQIVPPCSTLPLSAALFGCFPSPQMQGAEGCSLSFQKLQAAPRAIRRKRLHSLIFFSTQKPPRLPASETGAVRLLYGFYSRFSNAHTITCGDF